MSTDKTNCNKKHSISLLKAVSLLTLIAVLALSLVVFAACDKKRPQPKLLFSDEFDSDSLDATKWFVHGGTPNEGDPGEVSIQKGFSPTVCTRPGARCPRRRACGRLFG